MNIKKQTKKTAIGLLVLGQMMTTGVLAAPQEAISAFKDVKEVRQDIGHFKGEIKLFIEKDGKKTRVDQNMKDGLRVVEGRTCVGVRDLVNAIEGAEIEWDQVSKIVDIIYDGKTISYPLGKPVMWDGDKMVTIDVPAQVDPSISRTFLPIRNIAETLGFKVDWNQKTKEVTLTPGASTGQTTTQQTNTKPKANTNTENLSWVTASGQKIPKRNELPSDPGVYYSPKKDTSFYIYQSDVTNNSDGSVTYFKGTPLEFTTQPKFKYVKKSPEWGGFNLFGPSGNDPRVGLAAFQDGHPEYDKWKAKQIKMNKETYQIPGLYQYVEPNFSVMFMPHGLFEEYKHRRIDNNLIKQIPTKLKMDKNSEYIKYLLDDIENIDKFNTKWYDYTGVLDAHIDGVSNLPNIYNISFGSLNGYYITTDGYLISAAECEKYKAKIIDKVFYSSNDFSYVVDIPDINIDEWLNKIKYAEGTYGINNIWVQLHK
ncbi:MAG: copper amine oxidase N-terminal domain-containing protein [Eubacteriales bacterium]|nr:copper amine oxidase N-terminal domain-containing protein [Eubacteriales bacterium]